MAVSGAVSWALTIPGNPSRTIDNRHRIMRSPLRWAVTPGDPAQPADRGALAQAGAMTTGGTFPERLEGRGSGSVVRSVGRVQGTL